MAQQVWKCSRNSCPVVLTGRIATHENSFSLPILTAMVSPDDPPRQDRRVNGHSSTSRFKSNLGSLFLFGAVVTGVAIFWLHAAQFVGNIQQKVIEIQEPERRVRTPGPKSPRLPLEPPTAPAHPQKPVPTEDPGETAQRDGSIRAPVQGKQEGKEPVGTAERVGPVRVPARIRERVDGLCSWAQDRYPNLIQAEKEPKLIFLYRATPEEHRRADSEPAYSRCGSQTWTRMVTTTDPRLRRCSQRWQLGCNSPGFIFLHGTSSEPAIQKSCTAVVNLFPSHEKRKKITVSDPDIPIRDTLLQAYVADCGLRVNMKPREREKLLDRIASHVPYSRLQTWAGGRGLDLRTTEKLVDSEGFLQPGAHPGSQKHMRTYIHSALRQYIAGAIRATETYPIPLQHSFEGRIALFGRTLNEVVAGNVHRSNLLSHLAALGALPRFSAPEIPSSVEEQVKSLCTWAREGYPRLLKPKSGSRLQFLLRGGEPALYNCELEQWGPLSAVWINGSWNDVEMFWKCATENKDCPPTYGGIALGTNRTSKKARACNAIVFLKNRTGTSSTRSHRGLLRTVIHEYVIHCGLSDYLTAAEHNGFLELIATRVPYSRLKTWFGHPSVEAVYSKLSRMHSAQTTQNEMLQTTASGNGRRTMKLWYVEEAFAHLVDDYLVEGDGKQLKIQGDFERQMAHAASLLNDMVRGNADASSFEQFLDDL